VGKRKPAEWPNGDDNGGLSITRMHDLTWKLEAQEPGEQEKE
jgi:hypothetical protein